MPTNYVQRKTRSCAVLDGTNVYPDAGTILDISKWSNVSTPAGIRGPLITEGDHLIEQSVPGVAVRLIGNNTTFSTPNPCDPAKIPAMVARLRRKGFNLIRMHHWEAYWQSFGTLYGNDVGQAGTYNLNPTRLNETDQLIREWRANGGRYLVGPASSNMMANMGGNANRYDVTLNSSGTFSVTVDGVTGAILTATPATPSTGHFFPPFAYVLGGEGTSGSGAVLRAVINGAGTVTNIVVEKGGTGYVSGNVTCKYFGGTGRMKQRLPVDVNVQDHWDGMMSITLTRTNTETGLRVIDDDACVAVECMNEANALFQVKNGMLDYYLPAWHDFLKEKFGDINAFKTKTGYAGSGFCDAALAPKASGFTPGNVLDTWLYKVSLEFYAVMDERMYTRCVNVIRSLGWTRNIITRDLSGDPTYVRISSKVPTGIQATHTYNSLADDTTINSQMISNNTVGNAPVANSGGAGGSNAFFDALAHRMDLPMIVTEFASVFWNRFATEIGLIIGAVGGAHNIAGFVHHASSLINLKYGAAFNTSLDAALRPYAHDNHPGLYGAHIAGHIAYERGDMDPLPAVKSYTINDRALGFVTPANVADGTAPYFTYRQADISAEVRVILPNSRVVNQWSNNSQDATIANAWANAGGTGAMQATMSQLILDAGYPTTHEVRDWFSVRGNTAGTADVPWSAVRSDLGRRFGFNRLLGLSFMNTPRTQMAFSHKDYLTKTGTLQKQGILTGSSDSLRNRAAPGGGYTLNHQGNRIWSNLMVQQLDSGVLLSVQSTTMDPISTAKELLIVLAPPCYNTNQSFKSNALASAAVTITNATPAIVGYNAHGLVADRRVCFGSTGTLPAPLVKGTTYFVVNPTTNNFQVATTAGGAAIATTTTGSGTHTCYVNASQIVAVPVTSPGDFDSPPLATFGGAGGRPGYGIGVLNGRGLSSIDIIDGGDRLNATGATVTLSGGGGTGGAVLGTPVLDDDDPNKEICVLNIGTAPTLMVIHVAKFIIDGIRMDGRWSMTELNYQGYPTSSNGIRLERLRSGNGLSIRVDSAKTSLPSVFFKLSLTQ